MKPQKYPRNKFIAVDVDSTLKLRSGANLRLISWLREKKANDYTLLLWSARGGDYAKAIAEQYNVTELFDHIHSKPGFIVDDQGWKWAKYTKVVRNFET